MALLSWAPVVAVTAALGWFLGTQFMGGLEPGGSPGCLSCLLAVPAACALAIMGLPKRHERASKWIAAAGSLVSLVLSVWVAVGYGIAAGGLQFVERASWIPSLGVSWSLAADGISASMLLLTGVVIFTGCLASWDVDRRPKEFFSLLMLLVTGVFGVFASQDLFLFFLFYELAVLPMYLLIGIWGTGPREYSAMKLTLYLLWGSALMLVGILALYFTSGAQPAAFDMGVLRAAAYPRGFQAFFFPFVFIGFGTLAGFWPLHTWSPDGHASAPTAVSMLHAGVLMKLGAYGIIRIGLEMMPDGARMWMPWLAVFTVVNVTYGALVAMAQQDLKYVIAYSSVSHMGLVILGIATLNDAGLNGAVLQMFSHGIMTALFFALVGFTYGRTHTRMIGEYGGLGKVTPAIAVFFTLGGLASLGLPGLSGFVAEFMVFVGAWRAFPVIAVLAAAGIVFTAAYVLRVLQRCFWGPLKNPAFANIKDLNGVELACLSILSLFLVGVGLVPGPLVRLINSGVAQVLVKTAAGGGP
jgi:NADH-quinone oxidoreductase subunit M